MTTQVPRGEGPIALRPEEVQRRTGLKSTLFWAIQQPGSAAYDSKFPRSFSLVGGRARAYLSSEVDEWIDRRAATRTEEN